MIEKNAALKKKEKLITLKKASFVNDAYHGFVRFHSKKETAENFVFFICSNVNTFVSSSNTHIIVKHF